MASQDIPRFPGVSPDNFYYRYVDAATYLNNNPKTVLQKQITIKINDVEPSRNRNLTAYKNFVRLPIKFTNKGFENFYGNFRKLIRDKMNLDYNNDYVTKKNLQELHDNIGNIFGDYFKYKGHYTQKNLVRIMGEIRIDFIKKMADKTSLLQKIFKSYKHYVRISYFTYNFASNTKLIKCSLFDYHNEDGGKGCGIIGFFKDKLGPNTYTYKIWAHGRSSMLITWDQHDDQKIIDIDTNEKYKAPLDYDYNGFYKIGWMGYKTIQNGIPINHNGNNVGVPDEHGLISNKPRQYILIEYFGSTRPVTAFKPEKDNIFYVLQTMYSYFCNDINLQKQEDEFETKDDQFKSKYLKYKQKYMKLKKMLKLQK